MGEETKDTISDVVNDGSLITRFKPQIQELMEYQYINLKPTPTGSTHGDTVISLMLANQALKNIRPVVETKVTYPSDRREYDYGHPELRY